MKSVGTKLTVNYSVIQSFYNMSYCCVMGFSTVYLLHRGLTNSQIGVTLTCGNILTIVTQPLIAAFSDRTKKIPLRAILAAVTFVSLLFAVLLMLVPEMVPAVAVCYLLLVCFTAAQTLLLNSLAMEHINSGVSVNFGLARGIGSFAFAGVSFLMGFMVDRFGGQVIMLTNIFMTLGFIGTTLLFPRPAVRNQKKEEGESSGIIAFALENKRFMLAVLSVILVMFSHILINTYAIRIVESLGGGTAEMGVGTAIAACVEFPAMALFPVFLKKFKSAAFLLKVSAVFMVLKAVVTLAAPGIGWYYFAQSLQFFTFGMIVPGTVYYANRVIREGDKVKGQAWMTMSMCISSIVGTTTGGFLLDSKWGINGMYMAGIVVSGLGLLLLLAAAEKDTE